MRDNTQTARDRTAELLRALSELEPDPFEIKDALFSVCLSVRRVTDELNKQGRNTDAETLELS